MPPAEGPHLPLSETILLILLSLLEGPKHGYAIMQDVEALSAGRVRFSTGTLYGALSRLLDQGWIARLDDVEKERGRKDYVLTEPGRHMLNLETNRLRALVQQVDLRLSPSTSKNSC
jgi:DNA-binding PadR family transcriptional regulator